MFIQVDKNRKIIAYNSSISKEGALKYLDNKNNLWVDGLVISMPTISGKTVDMYLKPDNSVEYVFVDIESHPYQPTNAEVAQMINDLQADLVIAGVI